MTMTKNMSMISVGLACLCYLPNVVSQVKSLDTPAEITARVLSEGGASGGIEVSIGCEESAKRQYTIIGETVDDNLESLQNAIPQLQWQKGALGYKIVIGKVSPTSILQVVIPPITVDTNDISAATDQIFNRPEVQARLEKTRLKLFAPPIGYSSIKSADQIKHTMLKLPAGTIAKDLDLIAYNVGHKIWLYSTRDCSGQLNGRLLWIR